MLAFPSRIQPGADVPRTVRGRWRPTFWGLRGARAPSAAPTSFVWQLFVDGEQVQGPRFVEARDVHRDGRHWSEWTFDVDTTRFPDGAHEVLVYGYPTNPEPERLQRWHTHWTGIVHFANGPVAMALLPSVEQAVVADDRRIEVAARVLRCDGSVVPAREPVTLRTVATERVAIDGAAFRMRAEGWASVVASADGLSATIRAARYPADATALPHLGRDWGVHRRWDASRSRFMIAPFYQPVPDAMADPALADALHGAGLDTYHAHFAVNVERRTRAGLAEWLRGATRGWEAFVRRRGASFHLVADGVARTRREARFSLDNPDAPAAYRDAVAFWKRFPGYGVSVVDEAASAYRETPRPADRRWDHFTPPLRVTAVRGPLRVRVGSADLSRLPVVPAPARPDANEDRRPRVYVRTGEGAWRLTRLVRGTARGELTLAGDVGARVGDEVVVAGWWADADVPLPDDAIVRLDAMLEGLPRSWPPPGAAPGPAFGAWFAIGDFADVYYVLVPGNDDPVHPRGGATLPQVRDGREASVHRAQDFTSPALPLVTLVPANGPAYTKRSSDRAADFRPDVDALAGPGSRAIVTAMSCALALVEGACGVRPYFFDSAEVRAQRARETFPRTVLPEPLQTGFHPRAPGEGGAIFRTLATFRRLLDALGPHAFAPLGLAPALGPGIRTSRRGRLLLVANTREVVVTTAPFAIAAGRRWRWVGETLAEARVAADDDARLTLAPGELTALLADG